MLTSSKFCRNTYYLDRVIFNPLLGRLSYCNIQTWGSNLNLPASIIWLGRRGMCWNELDKAILEYLARYPPINLLLIHQGSNDLTTPELTDIQLIHKIQCSLYRYNVLLPNTTLIFSSMLPRVYQHGVPPTAWKKINSKRL